MADIYYSILGYNIIYQTYLLRYKVKPSIDHIIKAFDNDKSIEGIWH